MTLALPPESRSHPAPRIHVTPPVSFARSSPPPPLSSVAVPPASRPPSIPKPRLPAFLHPPQIPLPPVPKTNQHCLLGAALPSCRRPATTSPFASNAAATGWPPCHPSIHPSLNEATIAWQGWRVSNTSATRRSGMTTDDKSGAVTTGLHGAAQDLAIWGFYSKGEFRNSRHVSLALATDPTNFRLAPSGQVVRSSDGGR